jgi:N-acetylneuraminic acid mutarotase
LGDGGGGSVLKDWWEYDPATDNWTRKADNPSQTVLQWPAGMLVNNRMYVGTSAYLGTREWYEYQPASDTWTRRADFPGRIVFAPSSFVAGSLGYIMGGGDECWQYDPVGDRWTEYAFIRSILGGMAYAVNGRSFYVPGAGGGGSSNAPYLGREVWEFIP